MRVPFFLLFCVSIWSCEHQDKVATADASAAGVAATYAVTATEDGLVTVLAQFGSADALTQRSLPAGQSVMVDGQPIGADSSLVGGVFYELQKPLADFMGNHVIAVTQGDKNLFADSFAIEPFFLPDTLLPQSLSKSMALQLDNFTDTAVRVLLVDADFTSEDINQTYPVVDGQVVIPAADLQQFLVPGSAVLELYLEKEFMKRNRRLLNTYSVKRAVELVQ